MEKKPRKVTDPFIEISEAMRRATRYTELAKQLQETMTPFTEAMAQARILQASFQLDKQTEDAFERLLRPLQSIQKALASIPPIRLDYLAPFAKTFELIAEQDRAAKLIEQLGFVPHAVLWAHVTGLEAPNEAEREEFSTKLAAVIWPDMKSNIQLACEQCLSDVRLTEIFRQAQEAHEEGLYEAVISTAMTAIERAVLLSRRPGDKVKAFEWLHEMVGSLAASDLGSYGGFRTWDILVTKVFAGCWTDNEADNMSYPNRHAAAHGIGSKVAGPIDSLNAILLAHFAIQAAAAVSSYRDNIPEAGA